KLLSEWAAGRERIRHLQRVQRFRDDNVQLYNALQMLLTASAHINSACFTAFGTQGDQPQTLLKMSPQLAQARLFIDSFHILIAQELVRIIVRDARSAKQYLRLALAFGTFQLLRQRRALNKLISESEDADAKIRAWFEKSNTPPD